MVFLKAFLVGGAICALVEFIIDKTKLTPGRVMVGLVCTGTLLGAIGVYKPFSEWAECGATVPLLGFGNLLWEGMRAAIDKSGFLGLFEGGFTAGAIGISAALIISLIAAIIFKPKM